MSRYIEAEWLIKESMPLSFSVQKWVNEVQIMTAPSIDIVRCRECKHFWKYSDLPTKCVFHLSLVSADDFCSYGDKLND